MRVKDKIDEPEVALAKGSVYEFFQRASGLIHDNDHWEFLKQEAEAFDARIAELERKLQVVLSVAEEFKKRRPAPKPTTAGAASIRTWNAAGQRLLDLVGGKEGK